MFRLKPLRKGLPMQQVDAMRLSIMVKVGRRKVEAEM